MDKMTAKFLTVKQLRMLEDEIYNLLMDNPEMGMGEMGDCREAATITIQNWLEKTGLVVISKESN